MRQYAEAWGFRVLACDPPREEREHGGFLPLGKVAREADLLTFHTPLDASTRHMADAALFPEDETRCHSHQPRAARSWTAKPSRQAALQWVLDVWEHEPQIDARLLRPGAARNAPHRRILPAGRQRHGADGGDAEPPLRPAARGVVSAAGRPLHATSHIVGGALRYVSAKPL